MKKIDVFYKASNGTFWYLYSSTSYKTCKEAVAYAVNKYSRIMYVDFLKRKLFLPSIDLTRFRANFDKDYRP